MEQRQIIETNVVKVSRDEEDDLKIINQYKILKKIGEGAYGKVKLVYNLEDEDFYAIKKFNKNILQKKGNIVRDDNGVTHYKNLWQNAEKEMNILKQIDHPNIINLYEIINYEEQGKIYIVVEFAEKGEVLRWDEKLETFQFPDESKKGDLEYLKKVMFGTCKGLHYLHSQLIVHRDIKPQNILIDANDESKICDFGTANILQSNNEKLKGSEGTYHFMAPESLKDSKDKSGFYGQQADIFSLGVTFYCLLYQKLPFYHDNMLELFNQIQKKEIKLGGNWPSELLDLIQGMLIKNPKERYGLDEIINHPWFQQQNQNNVQ